MIVPDRLYHGGPAGLVGKLLPRDTTGVTGTTKLDPRAFAEQRGALGHILHGPDRVYLTSDPLIARSFACAYAIEHGQPYGTVYKAAPDAEPEPDIDTPHAWAVTSATITGIHDPVVLPSEWPKLERWGARHVGPDALVRWLEQFTSDDRADAFQTLNARAEARGEAGQCWFDLIASMMAGDFSDVDEITGAVLAWAAD